MTAPRTVSIDTRDRGVLTTTEPAWCADGHTVCPEDRPYSADIHHISAPVDIVLNTQDGPILLGGIQLWQDPFPTPTYPRGTEVHVSAYLAGESVDYPLGPLDDLAAAFIEAAGSIRLTAQALAALADGGAE